MSLICLPRRSGGDTTSDLGPTASSTLTSGAAAHLGKFYLSAQIASVTDLTAQLHHRDVHTCCPKERGGGDRNEELRLQLDGENSSIKSGPKSQAARGRRRVERHSVIRAETAARLPRAPAVHQHLSADQSCFN